MARYRAYVRPEGAWVAYVITIPGVGVTQAMHYDEIADMARDLIKELQGDEAPEVEFIYGA